jgi:son of sevenless-like protein
MQNGNESGDEVQHEPLSPVSINQPDRPRKFSETSIFMFQNSNEQLTWDSLSQSIVLAIQNLNLAASENLKQNYANCTNDIVESIRIMLYASGTVEKDSPAIRQDRNLKNYHRHIMASLSKLVLSTKVASGVWPPPDSAQKMRNDADEVLMAVRQFVQAAEQTVSIKRVDPKLLESATGGSWRGNNLLPIQTNGNKITNGRVPKSPSISSSVNSQDYNSAPNSPTNFTNSRSLTPDLIASLDQISRTANQATQLLLSHVKKAIDTPPNSSVNVSFFPQLISQTKQVVTQVGQFLPLIEEINLEELDESSLGTINEFNIVKQALYNNVAKLVIFAQSATDPLASLSALEQVLISTNMVDKAIKDVVIATKFLVEEKSEQEQIKLRPRRPSIVENPPTKRRVTSSYSTNSTTSNATNTLDQIVENDSSDSTENQSNTISPVSSSTTAGLQTVPENDIISTNGSTLIGDANPDDFEAQVSPTSANGRPTGNRARSDSTVSSKTYNDAASSHTHPPLQRSQTQPILSSSASADYPFASSPPPTGGNSGGTKSPRNENKVTKFFGEDVPSNLTQPNKQKEDKPWFLNYDYEPSEMIFNMESYVKGGTLNALVERLTMHDLLDSNFIATFLLTYRSFCTTDEFFDMLVKRFMIQPPENISAEELEVWQEKKQTPVRLRVFNIMKTWLETYYIDGQDSHCLERMREFATTTMHENMAFAAVSLIKVIEKRVCNFICTFFI